MARAAGESSQWPEREEAFKVFIGPRLDRAYGLARHLVGDHDAEDACQEALCLLQSLHRRVLAVLAFLNAR